MIDFYLKFGPGTFPDWIISLQKQYWLNFAKLISQNAFELINLIGPNFQSHCFSDMKAK